MESIDFEVLSDNVASVLAIIFAILFILFVIGTAVLYFVEWIMTSRIQKEYIESLDEHDKAVILDYKQQTWFKKCVRKVNKK